MLGKEIPMVAGIRVLTEKRLVYKKGGHSVEMLVVVLAVGSAE
jgi:hypothetical protein